MTDAWGAVNIICDSPSCQSVASKLILYGHLFLPSLSCILFLSLFLFLVSCIGALEAAFAPKDLKKKIRSICFFLIQPKETETNRKQKEKVGPLSKWQAGVQARRPAPVTFEWTGQTPRKLPRECQQKQCGVMR